MKKTAVLLAVMPVALTLSSCRLQETSLKASSQIGAKAYAEIMNTSGEKIGRAELTQLSKGVKIQIQASRLLPGKHGFHIHDSGSCELPDFKTAGEHFNPYGKQHGFENKKGPHAGDLPNLFVGTEGKVSTEMIAKFVTLEPGKPNSLLRPGGTSLIIHDNPDDYMTDPSGNSGGRAACGVIQQQQLQ